jgi:DNA replication and repair protein RecF
VRLTRLWLTDFRNYTVAELELPPGLTVVVGDNGAGKTNLLEAVGYLATLESFRGAPNEALVRQGEERAVVRGEAAREGRELLIEAEIRVRGRGRVAVNRQPLRRASDLAGALVVSVFSPDDLELVKGGPSARRRYLDDLLVGLHARNDALRRDLERILRQRTALLRDAGGRLSPALAPTLDVWDAKLASVGDALGEARADLVARLAPVLSASYAGIAGPDARPVAIAYEAPWRAEGLAAALAASRAEELRRAVCLVGPHRDELALSISAMPARTHASQGEQRSLALALRLAGHRVVGEAVGEPPVLLLDDVFSELDDGRSQALLDHLPPGQAILTTTGAVPAGARPDLVVEAAAAHLTSRTAPPEARPA